MATLPARYAVRAALLVAATASVGLQAQTYPAKPIRFVVPFGVGGPGDAIGRLFGRQFASSMGQPVVVDNRAGATTIIGTETVARSLPDGYTLLLISTTHSVNPSLFAKLPYDPIKDFVPVTLLASTPFMLGLHPAVPAATVQELVALARSKARGINYGSSGNGSSIHLTSELLANAARIQMTHIPYKGSGPAFVDLVSGQIQMLFSSTVSTLPHVRSGKVRGIAITSAKRAQALPEVPTVAETYPGFESSSWFGLLVPARTPAAIVARLLAESRTALKQPDVHQMLVGQGAEPGGQSPAEFAAYFQAEIGKWAKVIDAAGIRLDR